jgi:hypothetical protein
MIGFLIGYCIGFIGWLCLSERATLPKSAIDVRSYFHQQLERLKREQGGESDDQGEQEYVPRLGCTEPSR